MPAGITSTGSRSSTTTGGSTFAPATPSRCCGSTWRRPTSPRARRGPTRSSRSWAARQTDHRQAEPETGDAAVALDPKLLEILACPEDKGPLLYFEDESALYNPRLQRRYRVEDDIPIMLIDEAEAVDDAEHARLLAKADADGIQPTFAA